MKKKVSELSGAALDWAVAKCEKSEWLGNQAETYVLKCGYSPSTNWSQGGPIIEREFIGFFNNPIKRFYQAAKPAAEFVQRGPTPLIAAMRCYVASKLGSELEVPEAIV